jgi:hypothetical protein
MKTTFMATAETSRRWIARADTRKAELKAAKRFNARWTNPHNGKGTMEYYADVNERAIQTIKGLES